MVFGCTRGTFGARIAFAHRTAFPVQPIASFVIGAVFVVLTADGDARQQRVSLSSGRTHALGHVGLDGALGVDTARYRRARTDAVIVAAGFIVQTVAISFAFG